LLATNTLGGYASLLNVLSSTICDRYKTEVELAGTVAKFVRASGDRAYLSWVGRNDLVKVGQSPIQLPSFAPPSGAFSLCDLGRARPIEQAAVVARL
jgi:hypothetical protein